MMKASESYINKGIFKNIGRIAFDDDPVVLQGQGYDYPYNACITKSGAEWWIDLMADTMVEKSDRLWKVYLSRDVDFIKLQDVPKGLEDRIHATGGKVDGNYVYIPVSYDTLGSADICELYKVNPALADIYTFEYDKYDADLEDLPDLDSLYRARKPQIFRTFSVGIAFGIMKVMGLIDKDRLLEDLTEAEKAILISLSFKYLVNPKAIIPPKDLIK